MIQPVSRLNSLERELHLRQLQVQRLLQITQAINNNVAAEDLFDMYRVFLRKELRLTRMALLVRSRTDDKQWLIAASIGLEDIDVPRLDFGEEMKRFTRPGLHQSNVSYFAKTKHL